MKRLIITESQFKRALNEGKRYVPNKDAELPSQGRTAKRISPKGFEEKLKTIWDSNADEAHNGRFSLDNFVYCFMRKSHPKELDAAYKDVQKVKYDTENLGSVGKIKSDGGLTYLKCEAGGDWESPILFFLYWDGNKVRGYIPTKGNAINTKTNSAFGNDSEADMDFLKSEGADSDNAYQMVKGITYDVGLCLQDFKARVKVK